MKIHTASLLAAAGLSLAALTPARAATMILHSFAGSTSDGDVPYGSLTLSGSTLYGMTTYGGSNSSIGTLFSLNTDGSGYSLLHIFSGSASDGKYPNGSLTLSGSKLYGMTIQGGTASNGVVFSMNTNGSGFNLLHSFTVSASDGRGPWGSLTLSGSTLYGMTVGGGSSGPGAIFRMNTDGSGYSLLHSFTGGFSDGPYPLGSLTLSGSTLYGMTTAGGSSGRGALFSIGTDGSGFVLLESFTGAPTDGASPQYSDLTLSANGSTLYGMTSAGGTPNKGVVFSRAVPEPGTFALLALGTLLLAPRRRRGA